MKVTPSAKPSSVKVFNTKDVANKSQIASWWKGKTQDEVGTQLIMTASFLKETQNYRYRQASIYARLYGNMSLFNFMGSSLMKTDYANNLPIDRPTFNVVQSAIDTLVSKIGQNRPSPVFLTDNGDYKERNLAKKLNNFILGEFYQTKAYEKAVIILRDALVEGMYYPLKLTSYS